MYNSIYGKHNTIYGNVLIRIINAMYIVHGEGAKYFRSCMEVLYGMRVMPYLVTLNPDNGNLSTQTNNNENIKKKYLYSL